MGLSKEVQEQIKKAARLIFNSEYVTALTGAGVSVESGIRPFRGPGGLWTEKGEPPLDGYQRILTNPKKYWENRLKKARTNFSRSLYGSKPNPSHIAMAELEEMGLLKMLITQNIDGLHRLAGNNNVLEIHGTIYKLRCIQCNSRFELDEYDFSEIPPECKNCGGFVKSDTVSFGEPIPVDVMRRCFEESNRSDLMIVAGTSALVYPAAELPIIVKRNGGYLVEVNPMLTPLTNLCDACIQAKSGDALPTLVKEIKSIV